MISNFTVKDIISLDGESQGQDVIEIYNVEDDGNIMIWQGDRVEYFRSTDFKGNDIIRETIKYDDIKVKNAAFMLDEIDNRKVMLISIYI